MEKHKKDTAYIFKSKFWALFFVLLLLLAAVLVSQVVKKMQQKRLTEFTEQGLGLNESQEKTFNLILSLKVPFTPEGNLLPEQVEAQREAISEAQEFLIDEFGDRIEVYKVYTTLPNLAVRVNAETYEELRQNPLVTSISEDLPVPAN
ncbi:hypothetical protein H6802_00745 [Candidatus Nomurabacteria bacterium]|uniref:Inhibitor I9 domain-containing protein n=1 Tax=candidate division WWE3 bacterium TaxID=2053526 RepID=A0A955E1A0_UNCKA|nr:hypothetical protein [candidate division WWE3 bacterium]MCB9823474.1 hypothetical protein [Candidatus Nomurabacteria bacterium]MCB9827756.1 hypothetical protein [Candidatus Nomurabacteria bacterium]